MFNCARQLLIGLFCLAGCSGSGGGNVYRDAAPASTDWPLAADTFKLREAADRPAGDAAPVSDKGSGSCQPYCYPKGSKSQGWYDGCTHKILNLPGTNDPYWDTCENCTAQCRNQPAPGWYSSCTNQLIIMGCN